MANTYENDPGTERHGRVECPHCRAHQTLDDQELPWSDGDDVELECQVCTKPFLVRAVAEITHYIHKPDEL